MVPSVVPSVVPRRPRPPLPVVGQRSSAVRASDTIYFCFKNSWLDGQLILPRAQIPASTAAQGVSRARLGFHGGFPGSPRNPPLQNPLSLPYRGPPSLAALAFSLVR